jgi:phage-related protein
MTLATFTPPIQPSVGATNKPKVKILKADFGDGYSQSAADGVNNIRAEFSLTWEVLTSTDADTIEGFLTTQGGYQPFYWSAPGKTTAQKWTCETWERTFNRAGWVSIKATLTQSFNLAS